MSAPECDQTPCRVVALGGLSGTLSGVEQVNVRVFEALSTSPKLAVTWLDLTAASSTPTRGRWSLAALWVNIGGLGRLSQALAKQRRLSERSETVTLYLPLSQEGLGLYRDMCAVLLARLLLLHRLRVVVHLHGQYRRSSLKRRACYLIIRTTGRPYILSCVPQTGFSEGPHHYVPNSISPEVVEELHRQRVSRGPDGPPRIAYLGAISPGKGIHVLAKALGQITDEFRLMMIGPIVDRLNVEGRQACTEEEWLSALSRLRQDSRIQFLGPKYGPDKLVELANATHLVLPSLTEGAPVVILEAIEARLGIVASEVGAIPLMVEGYRRAGGYVKLVPPGDACALGRAIRSALEDSRPSPDLGRIPRAEDVGELVLSHLVTSFDAGSGSHGKALSMASWSEGVGLPSRVDRLRRRRRFRLPMSRRSRSQR